MQNDIAYVHFLLYILNKNLFMRLKRRQNLHTREDHG